MGRRAKNGASGTKVRNSRIILEHFYLTDFPQRLKKKICCIALLDKLEIALYKLMMMMMMMMIIILYYYYY